MPCAIATLFLACLGAAIGSFLNVVIYRLPRGMSVARPRRSFCPSCEKQIEWYDNIPVASWIALKGRCRHCSQPISLQYPIIETAGVVVTMLVWQAVRMLCADKPVDACWPALVGMLGLFYCLLALSAMDLKEYYVDIRLTWLALLIGLTTHALTPGDVWPAGAYVGSGWAAFALGAVIALVILHRIWPMPPEEPITDEQAEAAERAAAEAAARDARNTAPASRTAHVAFISLLAVVAGAIVAIEVLTCLPAVGGAAVPWMVGLGMATLFGSILAASWLPTEADEAIAEAVEAERSMAVRQAAREGVVLLACGLAGWGLMWLVSQPPVSQWWLSVYDWAASEQWRPVAGLGSSLFGWVLAGGICWLVRVLFTLALRKEALGFGDIHIIAAVGAVLGPHLAIAGFFLAAPVALLGTLVLVFRKRYRTLPFGPWLSMGFLLALLWGSELVRHIDVGLSGLGEIMRQ